MEVVESIGAVRRVLRNAWERGQPVHFVPTMGALHAGHVSLMEAARDATAVSVASIFVNPTQFAPHEDLDRYPRPRARDLELCAAAGVDLVFYPPVAEMYPPGAKTFVEVPELSAMLEGAIRPTHFRGVTTVVAKLFHIVQPTRAFFGRKDFQQVAVLKTMVRDLDFPVDVVTCPTIRDHDGLALSSRNAYLSPVERAAGLSLSRGLRAVDAALRSGERSPPRLLTAFRAVLDAEPGLTLDYARIADPVTLIELENPQAEIVGLVAGRVGSTRLIDNSVWTIEAESVRSEFAG